MKRILLLMLVLIGCWACEDSDPLVLDLDPTLAFIENEKAISLSFDDDSDSVYVTTIQLIGKAPNEDVLIDISMSESSTAKSGEQISYSQQVTLPSGETAVNFSFSVHGGALKEEDAFLAEFLLAAQGYTSGANVSKLSINIQKQAQPECNKDFTEYTNTLSVTTGDSWGYSWDWNGATDRTLVLDENIPNRLANYNFYGWSDSQPVLFELSCTDNLVSVIPIVGYTTPGGYTFDITGGTGTYDDDLKSISVTFNCNHATDGEFTITETYTKVCGVDASEYTGPLTIKTEDSWGWASDWGGATDLMLIADEQIVNRLSSVNFYGWSDAQPVYFDLSCDDNSVTVVPISGYATPGGYTFDITGGSGTYNSDTKQIIVTYNCSHESDGAFTIKETYN